MKGEKMKTHVFLIGSKGIPAQYGGFETFVEKLTAGKISKEIFYHVSCMDNDEKHFEYNGADCFNVKLPLPGPLGRMLHVSRALSKIETWRKTNYKERVVVYILGYRIGPFLKFHAKKLKKMNVKIYSNPDGLEWKRDKWNAMEKAFLKYCEKCLVSYSDLLICDSQSIESYIREKYKDKSVKTTYIAYGAEVQKSTCSAEKLQAWYDAFGLKKKEYYLGVGRFVPENNFETMLAEFIKSKTKRDLVLITNVEHNKFYDKLKKTTGFDKDPRIKFVGTVYDQELLKKIREEAYGYLHGHSVGGTNPSLLEALGSTDLNLLFDVGFNKEVGEDFSFYWNLNNGSLSGLIDEVDNLGDDKITEYGNKAKVKILNDFQWKSICEKYEEVLQNEEI